MGSRYVPYRRGVGAMLNSPEMAAGLRALMEPVKAAAVADTPVGEGDGGHIREAYVIGSQLDGGANGDRAEAWVANTHPAALPFFLGHVSQGGKPVPGNNSLARAIDVIKVVS